MTNQPRAGVRGRVRMWLGCGVGHVFENWRGVTLRRCDKTDKNMARVRARKGHPTPHAFAMQSRHVFCIFRLSIQLSLRTVRVPLRSLLGGFLRLFRTYKEKTPR